MGSARVVAIAGAGGGLGPTVVRAFAAAGDVLALAGREAVKLEALLDNTRVPSDRRLASAVDLLKEEEAASWRDEILHKFGRVDVVLHLVGGYKGGTSIADIPTDDWTALHQMLVLTTLNVVRAFSVSLRGTVGGRFLAVTSPKVRAPTARSAIYSMAKAASDALVLALADELRGSGATANLIEVDSIDIPEARQTGTPAKPYGKTTPAEEVAAAMLYLCSSQAATINGIRLALTGRG